MNYVNLNGKIIEGGKACLPIDNGAFRYGYGLFESILVENGRLLHMDLHFERLFTGMKQLCFEIPAKMTPEYLDKEIWQTVKKNKLEKLCRVRVQLFAGGGGLYSSENNYPGFVIESLPLEPGTLGLNENGLVVGIAQGLFKSIDSLSNLKTCSALIYAIAARQARENKWNDALICNTNGNIIESTIANIFWIKGGTIFTPPLLDGCIAGVMRRVIISKTPITEKTLTAGELLDADEVFLTNSIRSVRWIGAIGEKQYTCNLARTF